LRIIYIEEKISAQTHVEGVDADEFDLLQCDSCKRSFNAKTLEKHAKVCVKVFQQKRKAFDTRERRWDHVDPLERPTQSKEGVGAKKRKPNWRDKSDAFRAAISCARQTSPTGSTVKTAQDNKVYHTSVGGSKKKRLVDAERRLEAAQEECGDIQKCPHCQRKFNTDAAERHIPICMKTFGSKGRLMKGGGNLAASKTSVKAPTQTSSVRALSQG